jgi:hypothetical protein
MCQSNYVSLGTISDLRNKSIVAVHGLNGHYLNTWTWQDPEMTTNWLTDLLPAKLSNARIMSFAYNANIFTNQSTGEIMDHAADLLDYLDLKRDEIPVRPKENPIHQDVLTARRSPAPSSSSLTASEASL